MPAIKAAPDPPEHIASRVDSRAGLALNLLHLLGLADMHHRQNDPSGCAMLDFVSTTEGSSRSGRSSL